MQAESIVGIKYLGKQPSIDIEVDSKEHLFYGNGIITSNSHSVSYSLLGYWSAWIKTHFPLQFYTSWLTFSKHKPKPKEEIRQLIRDAKYNGVTVNAPNLGMKPLPGNFAIYDKNIYFGLRDIKGIGNAQLTKLQVKLEEAENKCRSSIKDWTWFQFLTRLSRDLSTTVVKNVISVGGLDFFNLSRRYMLFEYNNWIELTDREISLIKTSECDSFLSACEFLLTQKLIPKRIAFIKDLITILNTPPSSLVDNPIWINKTEQDLLGIPLTVTKSTGEAFDLDTECREFNAGKKGVMILQVDIIDVKETAIKNGSNKGAKMAFIDVQDDSGELSAVAFMDTWKEYQNILYKGNSVVITGERSKKDSFVIKKARQI